MRRIGILGDIGSGKSFVAKNFGYPVFNADYEVAKIYESDKRVFSKLKKLFPQYISSLPIDKNEITKVILAKNSNLKKIIQIIHKEVRKRMNIFIKKNKNQKIIILDIPLLLENKINKKKDILIFVESKKKDILKRLIKRKNFNKILFDKFKKIQFSKELKKKQSHFTIQNNFKKKTVKRDIKIILNKIL